MSEKMKPEMISRRGAFSLLGLAAAAGPVVPATLLTVSDAEAQTTTTTGTRGQQRRGGRQERRGGQRRGGRQERCTNRRAAARSNKR